MEGERCAEELIARGQRFTAVVCANDRLAVGAIAALRRHGLRCPEDISVTGYNDMPLADRLLPALTTVRVQHYKGGHESAELIVELMRGAQETRHIVLPVEIVIRASTRRNATLGLPRPKPRARAQAFGLIWRNTLQVGFIGLGAMGALIVPRLMAAGHSVTGWNRSRDKADAVDRAGMAWADTPRAVAEKSEIVFSIVTDGAAVRAVALGQDGVLAGLRAGRHLCRHEHDRARRRAARSRRSSPRPAASCSTRRSPAAR